MANSTKTFVAEISISEGVEVLESTVGPSTVRTVDSDQISCYSAKVLGTNTQKTTSLTAPRSRHPVTTTHNNNPEGTHDEYNLK